MTPMPSSPRQNNMLLPLAFSILLWLSCSAFSPPSHHHHLPSCRLRRFPRQQHVVSSKHPDEVFSLLVIKASNNNFDDNDDDDDRSRPNIVKIQTHQDYVNFLQEDDRLCLVKFYASWCKSCKRFGVSFRHLAYEDGDHLNPKNGDVVHLGNARFAEVEYSANAQLCKTLKVRKLPTVHYYKRGEGKLSELTCKPSQFQVVVDEMNRLLDGNYNDVDDEVTITNKNRGDSVVVVDGEEQITVPSNMNDVSNNVTTSSSSFDEALANLSEEIMKTIQTNQTASVRQEKNPWFRF